jgi:hypothetical protein
MNWIWLNQIWVGTGDSPSGYRAGEIGHATLDLQSPAVTRERKIFRLLQAGGRHCLAVVSVESASYRKF